MTDTRYDVLGRISELWIYPVKSCAGIALSQARLSRHGLQWDRHWMVVDADGVFLTQRSHPRMAWIRPEITDAYLLLHFPGMDSLQIPLGQRGGPCRVRVWKDSVDAWDLGEWAQPARHWLSQALAEDCRLVRFDASRPRRASERWVGDGDAPVHFADGYPLLLLSQSAVDELNQRLLQAGEAAVDARRFRANIVIADMEAHDEDRVEQLDLLDLPGLSLKPCKPCTRCPIPDVDPDTALPGTSVGESISRYRQDPRVDGAITFGMNAMVLGLCDAVDAGAELAVGQQLAGNLRFD
ncbi:MULTISPECIES: MOSC domain-containing protein [Comamonas]|uniref:MOSC domain-containing protein n=1 Tax=Comamonas TaxID=283 RepID=UPI0012C8FD48|nr:MULTISPECIES: MOSC N-terminal beta barrel domain-containing protein [Comamonas]MEB5963591.1 MOSC N-terminal beta barrel domain-containing protein [Comamonas testosteroni]MPS92637.1 MOSC domain-containing protein [Comamonas sp.]